MEVDSFVTPNHILVHRQNNNFDDDENDNAKNSFVYRKDNDRVTRRFDGSKDNRNLPPWM